MTRYLALLTTALLLAGCQNLVSHSPDQTSAPEQKPATVPAPPETYGSFREDTLYDLLVAELAGQRNRFDIALANYLEQAKSTQDPGIAERAFRIAEYLGADNSALETAVIWARNAPDNLDAQRAAAIMLARAGRYDESMIHMEKVLQGQGDTHFDFLALSAAETDADTREGLLKSFDRLQTKYPDNGQLLFGKALLLQQDGRVDEALKLLDSQPAAKREVAPLLLHARMLQSLGRSEEALPLLEQGIKQHPDDKRLLLAHARLLVEQGELDKAKQEFADLVAQFPDDDDLRFSLALVCLEAEAWTDARTYLDELVQRGSHVDAAHFNLGRVAEELNEPEQAMAEYALVGPGSDYLPAQQRQAELLMGQGRFDEAKRLLAQSRQQQPDYAIQLYLLEAESLTNNGQPEASWDILQQGLKQYPNDLNLLYTRAMVAEKRGDLAQLEKDLRFILAQDPNNAMALNALGYTLADRTTRYAEARTLIEKAHQINPNDPAILDSMGWINYRQGQLEQAERYLREALERFPDAEIGAHLGEVLWAQGKKDEAREVWATAAEQASDNAVLRSTLKRLTGSETL
ncbi:Flp pilus assembly protein TadD [Pseudomonas duriflava]|uniref:Flp pilus assembly protein TadD n=1 Tax=Pseudomonas duriflava TaxID=459528 RepID=A0A562QFV7_9PSED|nr:tetratricopeptide repeat protein [Pseudomonas duriflava]TWI54916.1 Flp pilus assembly protein TadD [Pseudomonas duriflava]